MPHLDPVTIVCLVGATLCGVLYPRASRRVWWIDQDGDGVTARRVCGFFGLLCAFILVLKVTGRLGR
ncbi:hypothetical protein KDM41_10950 [bacterium]|nr:hypothetical protein [bacterium]